MWNLDVRFEYFDMVKLKTERFKLMHLALDTSWVDTLRISCNMVYDYIIKLELTGKDSVF